MRVRLSPTNSNRQGRQESRLPRRDQPGPNPASVSEPLLPGSRRRRHVPSALTSLAIAVFSLLPAVQVQVQAQQPPAAQAPSPARTPPATTSAETAAAPAGGESPKVKVERGAKGKKVYRITEEIRIEGKIQKPEAFFFYQKSSINYDWQELKQEFVPRILESVSRSPF